VSETPARYFRITQYPKNNANIITIPYISNKEKNEQTGIVRQVDAGKFGMFLNFYERPVPLVSDTLKRYIEPLQPEAIGKPLGLASNNEDMRLFWLLNLPVIDSVTVNRTTLPDITDISNKKIFAVLSGMRRHVYVDMDMLEAMLRGVHVDFGFSELLAPPNIIQPKTSQQKIRQRP